ncbi:hypothetical protein [Amycolatopsis sp. CA-128772]|nr:hypothetical protein [Amycolatopsis sp. CA-128772]
MFSLLPRCQGPGGRWTSMVQRVVRSTRVAIAEPVPALIRLFR